MNLGVAIELLGFAFGGKVPAKLPRPTNSDSTATNPDSTPQMAPVLVSATFINVRLTVTSQTGTTTAFFPDIDP